MGLLNVTNQSWHIKKNTNNKPRVAIKIQNPKINKKSVVSLISLKSSAHKRFAV